MLENPSILTYQSVTIVSCGQSAGKTSLWRTLRDYTPNT